jgi:hypothetical protein
MNPVSSFLCRHPWIFVVFAFALLIGAWSTLISLAAKYGPQQIEVSTGSKH